MAYARAGCQRSASCRGQEAVLALRQVRRGAFKLKITRLNKTCHFVCSGWISYCSVSLWVYMCALSVHSEETTRVSVIVGSSFAKPPLLQDYGFARRAMEVYERATKACAIEDRMEVRDLWHYDVTLGIFEGSTSYYYSLYASRSCEKPGRIHFCVL